eukprot:CAMPEP_0119319444 /NCGR_PEP_ID=MMETSP1333-20130426/49381_1 /TAXON_ID=418940 /ORGANISM="Scyphosphaera apsteinii, Strain RCC1455" /LENGTH=55 /DNA_ID=CAMNT_0007325853 /DNA_START=1023 /DNA_END=1190 /DNA_ORIENTATION=-
MSAHKQAFDKEGAAPVWPRHFPDAGRENALTRAFDVLLAAADVCHHQSYQLPESA